MRATIAAVLALATLLVAACARQNSSESTGLAHIHGLGLNPADNSLYAGTHYGVYRITADGTGAERVGDMVADFMGFTVAGPDHFLGSGHPGEGDRSAPANVGLIESADGGRTWAPLSLRGEADFHALKVRGDTVFGLDSRTQTVLVSTDRRTWEPRAAINAADIAVSPTDQNIILASTPDGLARSTDQARTFSAAASGPVLALLSWPDDGPLVGVDPAGTAYVSGDSGATWQQRQAINARPEALLAAGDGVVFLATTDGILRSTDNATTFHTFYTPAPQ
ncbi:F510_1955 family glycosylhydrolase [Mycolicibacterium fortuitum]